MCFASKRSAIGRSRAEMSLRLHACQKKTLVAQPCLRAWCVCKVSNADLAPKRGLEIVMEAPLTPLSFLANIMRERRVEEKTG